MSAGTCGCTAVLPGVPVLPIRAIRAYAQLTREAMDALFGRGAELTQHHDLPEAPNFVSNQSLTLLGPTGTASIRIIGPLVSMTEIVISHGIAEATGMEVPVRLPGDQDETGGGKLQGPSGTYDLDDGILILQSHLRLPRAIADPAGLSQGCEVGLWLSGERPLVLPAAKVVVTTKGAPEAWVDAGLAALAGVREGDVATAVPRLLPQSAGATPPQAAAEVVTENDIVRAHHRGQTIRADQRTIVTPAAADADRRYHVLRFAGDR